jgi:hypothetical protein
MLQAAKRPEVEPDFDPPILVRMDFLALRPGHQGDLRALDLRAARRAVRGGGGFGRDGHERVLIFRIAFLVGGVGAVARGVDDAAITCSLKMFVGLATSYGLKRLPGASVRTVDAPSER